MKIDVVSKKDLPYLAELYQQLVPNEVSIKKMEEVLDKHKQNPDHMVFVAKVDDLVVGSLLSVTNNMLFGQCKSFMVIEDVVVNEHMRNQGIGKALMDHAESYAKQNNCSYIMLITDIDRKESQNFYKSIGYKTSEYCAFKKHL